MRDMLGANLSGQVQGLRRGKEVKNCRSGSQFALLYLVNNQLYAI